MGTGLALGLLVVMCGFIAYSGDLLGRRLGKRRLTLWGLRPRHTAIVVTVFTGMLIAGLSLAAMIGFSAGVRRAVIHGEALLLENWTLKHESKLLKQDNARQARLSQTLQERNEQSGRQIAAQIQQIEVQGKENRRLAAEKENLQRTLAVGKVNNARMEASRRALETRIENLEANRRQLLARNDELRHVTRSTQRQLRGVQRQLVVATNALFGTTADLLAAQSKLAEVRKQNRFAMDQAFKRLDNLRATNRQLQEAHPVARKNEELARTEIPLGASDAVIRDAVSTLIHRAEAEVSKRYRLVPAVRPPQLPLALQPSWAQPGDIVNRYVNMISTQGQGVVLRAVVHDDSLLGAPVPVRIDWKPNELAFRKGEEIAAVVVDGSQTEGALLRRLLAFLQDAVRTRALRRGVLPTTDGRVGEIQYDPLLETVKKIREIGGPARVGAVASNDVWSAGPLGLDFYVLPGESRVADGPQ
jgi:uncharacterized protein (DUF3084 family)